MFELYKEEHKMFPFEDYKVLVKCADKCKSVLEFGPGYSTLALVEAGVNDIHTCEYDIVYYQEARRRFAQYPNVGVHYFTNEADIYVPGVDGKRFDLAFVDTPVGQGRNRVLIPGQEEYSRLNTVLYALARAPVVLLHDCHRRGEQMTLKYVNARLGKKIEVFDTAKGVAMIC